MTRCAGVWPGPGQFAALPFAVPLAPWLLQLPLYAQGVLFDPAAAATVPIGLTNALALTIGS